MPSRDRRLISSATLAAALFVCAVGSGCGPGRARAGLSGKCAADVDCATGLVCAAGSCTLPAGQRVCTPGARSCAGADLVECDVNGAGSNIVQTCPGACREGACVAAVCALDTRRCGAAGVEVCARTAGGALVWQALQACPTGCDPGKVACLALACRPLETRCSPTAPGVLQLCASDGSGFIDAGSCGPAAHCSGGACVALACTPGAAFCDGSDAVLCAVDGSGAASRQHCAAGCASGVCRATACAPGATRCSTTTPGLLESCLPDGSGFAAQQQCPPLGSDASAGCALLSSGLATCTAQLCVPLARRCNSQGAAVEVCSGDGLSWLAGTPCSDGCANGICAPPPSGCTVSTLRCAGASLERCDALSGGGTGWDAIAQCLGGCASGACLNGSGGGGTGGGSCTPPAALTVALQGAGPAPADGASTFLAATSPLIDASGSPLPDGTFVTVSAVLAAGAPVQLVTAVDADPATPGVQVRTVHGRADFAFRAPPASALDPAAGTASVIVSAAVAGAAVCSVATRVGFGAAGKLVYLAEDFTSASDRDAFATTADWNTAAGALISRQSSFGTGTDGDLIVAAGQPWDLTQSIRAGRRFPDGVSARVTSIGANSVQLNGSSGGFSAGDEVLLIELQGASPASAPAAGTWETLTVATAGGGVLGFSTAVASSYGAEPGVPLAGERVVVQRIPQFGNVTVQAGATLTAAAWDGSQGGIVAFRASGTVAVAAGAAISADGLGYRGGGAKAPVGAAQGQSGESVGGFLPASANPPQRNFGAGGGGYLLCDAAHTDQIDSWFGAGGSYGDSKAGDAGSSKSLPAPPLGPRAACLAAQGAPYGGPTLARLFPGSGSGTQEYNTHQPCGPVTCPGESTGSLSAATHNNANTDCPAGSSCATSFSICATENIGYAPAALPCTDSACTSTFSVCGGYDNPVLDDSASCYSSCPGLVTYHSNDCGQCGCSEWGAYACILSTCQNGSVGYCDQNARYGDCGGDGTTGFFHGCDGNASNCSHPFPTDYCNSNCNVFGTNCDCHYYCYTCYSNGYEAAPGNDCGNSHCESCNRCGGCVTNPGCIHNPGCATCTDGTSLCDIDSTNLNCRFCPLPSQKTAPGASGGGIVFVSAAAIDLTAGGRLSSNGANPAVDAQYGNPLAGGSGGSLWIRTGTLSIGTGSIQAVGGVHGGDGRIRLDSGPGDGPGSVQIRPAPGSSFPFGAPLAQSRSVAPAGTQVTSIQLLYALDSNPQPPVVYSVSAAGAAGPFSALVAGGPAVAFPATTDLRWRAALPVQPNATAWSAGVALVLQLK